MPEAVTIRSNQILIKVGDGASPTETFAHPCLINTSRGIQFTADGSSFKLPNCDNPSDPAWTRFIKSTISATVNGAGTLNVTDVPDFFDWLRSPDPKNVQIVVGILADTVGGHFAGAFHLTEFTPAEGDDNEPANCSLVMQSDGVVTWVAAT